MRERSGFYLVRPRFFFDAANVSHVSSPGRRTSSTASEFGQRSLRFAAPEKRSLLRGARISHALMFFFALYGSVHTRGGTYALFFKSLNLAFYVCTGAEGKHFACPPERGCT